MCNYAPLFVEHRINLEYLGSKSMKYLVLLALLSMSLVACDGDGDIQAVTPLPTENEVSQILPTATENFSPTTEENAVVLATPTPLDNNLAEGEARSISATFDAAFIPTPRGELLRFDENPIPMTFDEFYEGYDMRRGWTLTDKLVSLDGQTVIMEGYVAPPLKPEVDFFVLTQIPLAFCPFCSSDADWPDRVALVYLPEESIFNNQYPVAVTGRMEIGSSIDQETGMVSLVRIYADDVKQLN